MEICKRPVRTVTLSQPLHLFKGEVWPICGSSAGHVNLRVGPQASRYQLETFQSKQRGIYEEGVKWLFFAGHKNNFTGVAFGLK